MAAPQMFQPNRRGFLRVGAAALGGLLVRFSLPADTAPASSKLNAFVRVGSDDSVTLFIHKAEMGQGTVTSLSVLLAEELECDWSKIRTEFPGVSREYGAFQGVVGSQSIRTSYEPLRKAGAAAREMLISAAAHRWGVAPSACRASNNTVINTVSGEKLTYGSLAEAAAKLPVPANVALKDPKDFRLIGKPAKRLDTPVKVDGSAKFGIDVRLPGMMYAVITRSPVFGGKLASFDASKAKAVPGVKDVFPVSSGVAVLADNTWTAMQGRRSLEVRWDEGPLAALNTPEITKRFAESTLKPGAVTRKEGDAGAAMGNASKRIEAVYQTPYLAHAPMEPLNCTADVRSDSCEVWASTQGQSSAQSIAMKITGLPAEKVRVYTEYMGGGFGRRARPDYIAEAVEVSKAAGAPVKLTWSREDDMQQDAYRPASFCRMAAGLDAEGWPVSFTANIACAPFGGRTTGVEGVHDVLYAIPNILVEYHAEDPGIPVSYWRSVGYSQNTFFAESFLDEMAAAGRKDPLALRQKFLVASPRMLAVLNLAADKAGWGKPLPDGHGRGLSVVNNIGSFTAQVAEVSVTGGKVRVHKVVCAVDCGQVVNPSGVEQQIRSGIVFGMTAALKGGISIDRGRVQQGNFDTCDMLRMDEAPVVDVHLVKSDKAPSGIGEASTPGIAPALCNAIFAASGTRVRSLPVKLA